MWNSTGPHYCPVCPPLNRKDRRIDPPLELIRENYSGCGVDIGQCPTCQRYFQVSYKVDKIIDVSGDVAKAQDAQAEHNAKRPRMDCQDEYPGGD